MSLQIIACFMTTMISSTSFSPDSTLTHYIEVKLTPPFGWTAKPAEIAKAKSFNRLISLESSNEP
jgi:hypothetical protein